MAEGWTRRIRGGLIDPYSAGVEAHGLNPYAVRVMAEAGIDISGQHSKLATELGGMDFDFVVTLSSRAQKSCPVAGGKAQVVHVGLESPPRLAASEETDEARLMHYRRVRDQIRAFVESLPASLYQQTRPQEGAPLRQMAGV
jgi:arsenate reductase